jgi:TfdA family taurine catabolism dioxygenase TauD
MDISSPLEDGASAEKKTRENRFGAHLGTIKRRAILAGPDRPGGLESEAVRVSTGFPLLVCSTDASLDLYEWAADRRQAILSSLAEAGAVLFRGFKVDGSMGFEMFMKGICRDLSAYTERSSPRTPVSGMTFTSTEHPKSQSIFLHNENSYQLRWPAKIGFFCLRPPERGGETPIADCRRVLSSMGRDISESFRGKGILYVRNLHRSAGLGWEDVFQTGSILDAKKYCFQNHIEWIDMRNGNVSLRQLRPAFRIHPETGAEIWFNHGYFFNTHSLGPHIRQSLEAAFPDCDYPSQTFFGDGTSIPEWILDAIREAYLSSASIFSWASGDVLLLDNMLTAHGRNPYSGDRRIIVCMGDLREGGIHG